MSGFSDRGISLGRSGGCYALCGPTHCVRVVLAIISLAMISPLRSQQDGWQIERVDWEQSIELMTDRSLSLSEDEHLHVAYGGDRLYHAWHDGSIWRREIVDASSGVGKCSSIAMDITANAHIGYFDNTNDDLKYAHWNGSTWEIYVVDSNGHVGEYASIQVDGLCRPHISYYDRSGGELRYARKDGSMWFIQIVDTQGDVGRYSSLALDSNGFPHVVYYHDELTELRYAFWDGSVWIIATLATVGEINNVGWEASICLDVSDKPHVSYSDYTSNSLRYGRFDGTSWHVEVIDSSGGFSSSLALDEDGLPYVSYSVGVPDMAHMRVAYRDSSGWIGETVEEGGYWLGYDMSSLVIDGSGVPYVVYRKCLYDESDDCCYLHYAFRSEAGWQIEWLDGARSPVQSQSLAIDSLDRRHIAYSRGFGPTSNVLYASSEGSTWQIEELGSNGYGISLALDSAHVPHLVFFDVDSLKHAVRGDVGWSVQTVDDSILWYYGSPSIDIDGSDHPHLAYLEPEGLAISHWDGEEWQVDIMDSPNPKYPSITVDQIGSPHVSYFDDGGDPVLMYAVRKPWGWCIEVVDTSGYSGSARSLAVDSSGYPHIAYQCDGVRYAYKDESGWHIEVADSSNGEWTTGYRPSLSLNDLGEAHISHYAKWFEPYPPYDTRYSLRYTYKGGGTWYTESVGDAAVNTSIALDTSGRPCIGYKWTNHEAGYASRTEVRVAYRVEMPSEQYELISAASLVLKIAGPCPFRHCARIDLHVPEISPVCLTIYDLLGRATRVIHDGFMEPGVYRVAWDGFDDNGNRAPSGTYIVSAEAGGQRVSKRIVLLR